MSRFSRSLKRTLRDIKGGKQPWWDIISEWFDGEWESILDTIKYYEIKSFLKNIPRFTRYAWKHRDFDSQYSINLFADSLEHCAKCLKVGHHLNKETDYRRCMRAAAQLRRAYDASAVYDPSYKNWMKNNRIVFRKTREGYSEMLTESKYSKEYSDKMFKLINARVEKRTEANKKEAWEYISKNIEKFWD